MPNGFLEETLIYAVAQSSLSETHTKAAGWIAAQTADGAFISTLRPR